MAKCRLVGHVKQRATPCSSCKGCVYCTAPACCQMENNHIALPSKKRGKNVNSTTKRQFETLPLLRPATKTTQVVLLEEELEEEWGDDTNPMPEQGNHIPAAELIQAVKNNIRRFSVKEKLEFVLSVLESDDVENLLHGVRLDGYSAVQLSSTTNQREFRRMRNIYSAIVLGTDKIVCKDAIRTEVHKMMLVDLLGGTDLVDKAELKALNRLKRNTLDLSICGHSKVSAVASALLSGSFWRIYLDNATKSRFIQLQEEGNTNEIEAKYRQQFGKARFTTARTNLQLRIRSKSVKNVRIPSISFQSLLI
jgi:hypothetical protein